MAIKQTPAIITSDRPCNGQKTMINHAAGGFNQFNVDDDDERRLRQTAQLRPGSPMTPRARWSGCDDVDLGDDG